MFWPFRRRSKYVYSASAPSSAPTGRRDCIEPSAAPDTDNAIPQKRTFVVLFDPETEEKPSLEPFEIQNLVQNALAEAMRSTRPPDPMTPSANTPHSSSILPGQRALEPALMFAMPGPPDTEEPGVAEPPTGKSEPSPLDDEPATATLSLYPEEESPDEPGDNQLEVSRGTPAKPRRVRVPRERLWNDDGHTD